MKRIITLLLLLVNCLVLGIGIGHHYDRVYKPSEIPERLASRIASEVQLIKCDGNSSWTVYAAYHGLCTSCDSGASLDSLRTLVEEVKSGCLSLILLDHYSDMDVRNVRRIWGLDYVVVKPGEPLRRHLNRISGNSIYVLLDNSRDGVSIVHTVSELEVLMR